MLGVLCGSHRYSFEPDGWQDYATEGLWGDECEEYPSHAVEFAARGGPDGPDPDHLVVAELVAEQMTEFVSASREYLAAFVDPSRFQATGP